MTDSFRLLLHKLLGKRFSYGILGRRDWLDAEPLGQHHAALGESGAGP